MVIINPEKIDIDSFDNKRKYMIIIKKGQNTIEPTTDIIINHYYSLKDTTYKTVYLGMNQKCDYALKINNTLYLFIQPKKSKPLNEYNINNDNDTEEKDCIPLIYTDYGFSKTTTICKKELIFNESDNATCIGSNIK